MNILVIEDERKTAAMLREMIETHPDCLVVQICDGIEDSVLYLQKHQSKLDLIFMDIQLADGQSFEIFEQIQITVPVVFCTAYDEFSLKAFKNNGIDYILKPFKENDIQGALEKYINLKKNFNSNQLQSTLSPTAAKEQNYQTTFLVRFREKMFPILVADVALAYLENDSVYLFNFKGEKYIILKTMDQIEAAVSPQRFYRINRQMIVNRDSIKEIEPFFNRKAIVKLSIPMPEAAVVSRLKVTPFLDWIEKPH